MNLTREHWPLGWTPAVDEMNGDPQGLLRMRNLQPDKDGVLSLVRGTRRINQSAFSGDVHSVYSKVFSTAKHRFVSLSDGSTLVSSDDFANITTVIDAGAGASDKSKFGSMMGHVIASSALTRKKYNGTASQNLGIEKSANSLITGEYNQPYVDMQNFDALNQFTNWYAVEGTDFLATPVAQIRTDATTGRGIVETEYPDPIDTTVFPDNQVSTDEDEVRLSVMLADSYRIQSVEIDFLLDDPSGDVQNYYKYVWPHDATDIKSYYREGVNVWCELIAKKTDFVRVGGDFSKDWKAVLGTRVIFTAKNLVIEGDPNPPAPEPTIGMVGDLRIFGGSKGPLNGNYSYIQVDVNNTGSYNGKSEGLEQNRNVFVRNANINVYPGAPTDPQVNEIWIFRRNKDTQDQWYRVLVFTKDGDGNFPVYLNDAMSDDDAALINITYNPYLKSVLSIEEAIQGIETDVNGRAIYLTTKDILLSDYLDLDTYDPRYSVRLSGDQAEKNLWITKISPSTVLVGTTSDIYELSGSFNPLENDIIDITVRPMGLDHPPISEDFISSEGNVVYMSDDGWRTLSGATSINIVTQLKLLFENYNRFGLAPVNIVPLNSAFYRCAFARQKFWAVMPLQDGDKTMFIYDFVRKIWHEQYISPLSLFTEEDGTLLAGFSSADGAYLKELDYGTTIDGTSGQEIFFQTIFDHNGQPRNRKDTFTFKLTADTGNVPINIWVGKDGGNWESLGTIAFPGISERLFPLANRVGLGKSFSIKLTGNGLSTCQIYNFSIEYEPRPEQNVFLRIPYTNLGTTSRKRFVNFAFCIDTLGNDVTFTPMVDGEFLEPSNINFNRKGTYIHYFDHEVVGTDIGGVLECNLFEFYNVALDEIISEKMPVPVTFLIIPQTDYGNPNRKRHSSYKFRLNSRGQNVQFTPRIDGEWRAPKIFNTAEPQVCEYYFDVDTIGINIGGKLESFTDPKTPFEFYGTVTPQELEVLPPRLDYFRIPENNYGIAARKRIRTMPMEINTNGFNVKFTPIVDGVALPFSWINTSHRQTAFHYFTDDIFGIDFSGELVSEVPLDPFGGFPFEFYGLLKPEEVETLPVGKKFDQVGPVEFTKIGKLYQIRVRMLATGAVMPYTIYAEDEIVYQGQFDTIPNKAQVYEFKVPKSVRSTVFRMELGGGLTEVFHRYYVKMLINVSGKESDNKWVDLK